MVYIIDCGKLTMAKMTKYKTQISKYCSDIKFSHYECNMKCLICGHECYTILPFFSCDRGSRCMYERRVIDAMEIHFERAHKLLNVPEIVKPWQDPESLFCSPKLSEITKKEIKPCNQEGD